MNEPSVYERLKATGDMWSAWAKTATTDIVPDRYVGEPMPDGTIADRYWWEHADGKYHDKAPDAEDGPGSIYGEE